MESLLIGSAQNNTMGKLHTLRRAVQREPEKWFRTGKQYSISMKKGKPMEYVWKFTNGAILMPSGKWVPSEYRNPYRGFIKSVLRKMGYTDLIW